MFFFIKTCETLKRKSCSGKDLMPYIILMHNNQVAYTKEQIATKHRITTLRKHDQKVVHYAIHLIFRNKKSAYTKNIIKHGITTHLFTKELNTELQHI